MTDPLTPPLSSASSLLPAGRQLRNAREALELTPEQVASQLKLSVRQVNAIEQEAFDELPSNLFIRGFVRNYARLLNIDAEPLLAYLAEVLPNEQHHATSLDAPLATGVRLSADPISKKQRRFSPTALMVVLGALMGISVAFWFLQQPNNPELALPEMESPPVLDVPVASVVAEATPALASPASVASVAASAVTSTVTPVAASATAQQASATVSVDAIRIVSTTDSWVQIVDANGNKVLSEIIRPGIERTVDGKPPFAVKVGNAPKTSVYFHGQQVDLSSYLKPGSDVVNLELK